MELQAETTCRSGAHRRSVAAHRRFTGTAAAVLVLGTLAGCGSSSGSNSSAGGAAAGSSSEQGATQRASTDARNLGRNATDTLQTRAVISTARVSLTSSSLTTARADLDRLVARYGGYVDKEDTVDDGHGRVSRSTLELRVPADSFDAVIAGLREVGTVTSTKTQDDDVTTQVIDVEARVRTAEVSLRRLRSFLGRATNVDSVIRLESEISQREADLESTLAQQRYLRNQTSLSTITLSMTLTGAHVHHPGPLAHAGFLTGLRKGWHAFLDLVLVGATVAGAVLPFALVLALVGVPLAVLLRRRRRPVEG